MASSVTVEMSRLDQHHILLETSEAVKGDESPLSGQRRLNYVWLAQTRRDRKR